MLIGHIDTVLPDGEARRRPFTINQHNGTRIATGPGVLDMKSGVLIGMYALRLLIESQQAHYSNVTFICNSDEEIGSPSSRPLIQELAQQADAVLVSNQAAPQKPSSHPAKAAANIASKCTEYPPTRALNLIAVATPSLNSHTRFK